MSDLLGEVAIDTACHKGAGYLGLHGDLPAELGRSRAVGAVPCQENFTLLLKTTTWST